MSESKRKNSANYFVEELIKENNPRLNRFVLGIFKEIQTEQENNNGKSK